jgi:hypothetical protein
MKTPIEGYSSPNWNQPKTPTHTPTNDIAMFLAGNKIEQPRYPTWWKAADTAFIVEAVNAHKELVHTLANALHELRGVNANPFIIKQCEQAIARASAEQ